MKRKEKSWQEEPGEMEEQWKGERGEEEKTKNLEDPAKIFQDSLSLHSCSKVGAITSLSVTFTFRVCNFVILFEKKIVLDVQSNRKRHK